MQKMPFFLGFLIFKDHKKILDSIFFLPLNVGHWCVDGTDCNRRGENALVASEDALEGYESSEGNGSETGGGG